MVRCDVPCGVAWCVVGTACDSGWIEERNVMDSCNRYHQHWLLFGTPNITTTSSILDILGSHRRAHRPCCFPAPWGWPCCPGIWMGPHLPTNRIRGNVRTDSERSAYIYSVCHTLTTDVDVDFDMWIFLSAHSIQFRQLLQVKNKISHRYKAFAQLAHYLGGKAVDDKWNWANNSNNLRALLLVTNCSQK